MSTIALFGRMSDPMDLASDNIDQLQVQDPNLIGGMILDSLDRRAEINAKGFCKWDCIKTLLIAVLVRNPSVSPHRPLLN